MNIERNRLNSSSSRFFKGNSNSLTYRRAKLVGILITNSFIVIVAIVIFILVIRIINPTETLRCLNRITTIFQWIMHQVARE